MNLKRRLPQYLIGLLLMALGIVLVKKAEIGISPVSAIPAALSNLTPFTLGNTTIAFHVLCVLMQILLMRQVTLKTLLILPLAVAFGYLIDLYMLLLHFAEMPIWLAAVLCFAGIIFTALGLDVIVGADLMLPAPDALVHTVSEKYHKPLSTVKIFGDITWVAITAIIELLATGTIISVGIGTLASMLLTGKFAGIFKRLLPFLEMEPTGMRRGR
ncbi:MAG: DUF6198 family protein [Oscillospiraceae bacterium]|nr:DUF6198 family protein [Oscillospiraceae bacterium]